MWPSRSHTTHKGTSGRSFKVAECVLTRVPTPCCDQFHLWHKLILRLVNTWSRFLIFHSFTMTTLISVTVSVPVFTSWGETLWHTSTVHPLFMRPCRHEASDRAAGRRQQSRRIFVNAKRSSETSVNQRFETTNTSSELLDQKPGSCHMILTITETWRRTFPHVSLKHHVLNVITHTHHTTGAVWRFTAWIWSVWSVTGRLFTD